MANQKLTSKTALEEQVGSGDILMVVDVSDTSSSAQGTSKKQDFKYLMQTDKISVTNAEIDLATNPKTLVGALSGYMITVFQVQFICTYASSTESANKYMYMGYDSSENTAYWASQRSFMNGLTISPTYCFSPTPSLSGTTKSSNLNKPFKIWASGDFNGGWSADVYVTYAYTKVL